MARMGIAERLEESGRCGSSRKAAGEAAGGSSARPGGGGARRRQPCSAGKQALDEAQEELHARRRLRRPAGLQGRWASSSPASSGRLRELSQRLEDARVGRWAGRPYDALIALTAPGTDGILRRLDAPGV